MSTRPLSLDMVQAVMKRYRPGMMSWHYEHGLVLLACLKAGAQYPGSELAQEIPAWVQSMYSPVIHEDGSLEGYSLGEHNLDQINPGRALFSLFDQTGDVRWLCAIDTLMRQIRTQPRCRNGVFWHKEIYPWQIWLDGVYMQGPFNAQFCKESGDLAGFDDITEQVVKVYRTLKDEQTGLLYHAYDESKGQRWSDPVTGLSPHFWGRAIGWYCMAILDILDFLPKSHPKRSELSSILISVLDAVLPYQDAGGMWYQIVDKADAEGNYLETSCTSMFAYSLLKAVRTGLSKDDQYRTKALHALEGLKNTYLRKDGQGNLHLGGICSVAGLGGNPYRDGSLHYYFCEPVVEDDFKGVGPFILACLEAEQAL